jgi:hypothetical protein
MTTSIITAPASSKARLAAPASAPSADAWQPLYRIAGAAALLQVVLIAIQIPVFVLHPPPSTVSDFFALFERNWLLGLLNLDGLMLVNSVLMFPLLLALYALLRRASEPFMALALTLGIVANALCFAWNAAFTMLALSHQYAAAATAAERATFLAAGQALLTTHLSGTAFDGYYILSSVTMLIIGAVMVRSRIFSKLTAVTALLMGALTLVPPGAAGITLYLSLIVLAPTVLWLILVARRLFQLGQSGAQPHAA